MKKYINKLELKKGLKILKNKTTLIIFSSSFAITSLVSCSKKENTTENTVSTTEISTEYTNDNTTTELITENTTEYVEPTTIATTEIVTTETTTATTTEVTTEATTKESTETITETTTEATTEATENDENKSKDSIVTEFFNKQKEDLNELIHSENVEKIRAKGKDIFTTFVDFIFYDGEIKGVKYDELSEGIKEQLYDDLATIDSLIVKYSPDYKENLADKYQKVKDFISPYYYALVDKIKECLGEDNLDRLNSIKENGKDVISDLWEKGKEKIKEKYENWRDE